MSSASDPIVIPDDEIVSESSEVPTYEPLSDYEDFPMEEESADHTTMDGSESEPEEVPISPITSEEHAFGDDVSMTVPLGDEITLPSPARPITGGARVIHTARKRILPTHRRPRTLETETADLEPEPKRLKSSVRRWTWVTDTLREWRDQEGRPSTYELGESSQTPLPIPITEETMEHTIPLLVARCARHDRQMESLELDVGDIRESVEEIETLRGRVLTLEEVEYLSDQALSAMHVRATEAEVRAREAEQRAAHAEQGATAAEQQAVGARERADSTLALAAVGVLLASVATLIGIFSHLVRYTY